MKKKNSVSVDDKIFYTIMYILLAIILMLIAYPLIFIVSSSFSSTEAVSSGRVVFLPIEFNLDGYIAVFKTNDVFVGYRNSLFYAVVGTMINLVITILAAYPMSRKDIPGKGVIMFLFTFTMLFSGGMIPNYLLVSKLGMLDTVWAMLIPGALSVYNAIVMRTFFMSNIPDELLEASRLDGCSDFKFLFKIVLPLSKAVIAVVVMFYALGHWNAYFNAFLYLNDENLFPLQIILRNILLANKIDPNMILDEDMIQMSGIVDLMKYSLMVVATVPVLLVYPFVQKHFVKGVMIGSVKG